MHRPAGDGRSIKLLLLLLAGRREKEGGRERGGRDSSMELLKLILWLNGGRSMGLPLPFYLLGRGRSKGLLMPILAGEEKGQHTTVVAPTCWRDTAA